MRARSMIIGVFLTAAISICFASPAYAQCQYVFGLPICGKAPPPPIDSDTDRNREAPNKTSEEETRRAAVAANLRLSQSLSSSGWAAYRRRDWAEAARYFAEAARLSPGHAEFYNNALNARRQLAADERYREALRALSSSPSLPIETKLRPRVVGLAPSQASASSAIRRESVGPPVLRPRTVGSTGSAREQAQQALCEVQAGDASAAFDYASACALSANRPVGASQSSPVERIVPRELRSDAEFVAVLLREARFIQEQAELRVQLAALQTELRDDASSRDRAQIHLEVSQASQAFAVARSNEGVARAEIERRINQYRVQRARPRQPRVEPPVPSP